MFQDDDFVIIIFLKDVARLAQELDNVIVNGRIENSRWNHIDYLFGIDAPKLVYERLIADMKRV